MKKIKNTKPEKSKKPIWFIWACKDIVRDKKPIRQCFCAGTMESGEKADWLAYIKNHPWYVQKNQYWMVEQVSTGIRHIFRKKVAA